MYLGSVVVAIALSVLTAVSNPEEAWAWSIQRISIIFSISFHLVSGSTLSY